MVVNGEDITVEDTLLLVRNAVSDALEQEEHDYFKMLLQRVETSIESSEILLKVVCIYQRNMETTYFKSIIPPLFNSWE